MGHPRRREGRRRGPSGRHRRPLGRHTRRPGAAADPRRTRRRVRVPGISDHEIGTTELRKAAAESLTRRHGVTNLAASGILPVIGTKEAIAGLASTFGLGPGDDVVIPEVAYPTYEVSALLAGARPVRADSTVALGPMTPALMFVNSPSNPTGKVLPVDHLRKVVAWARSGGPSWSPTSATWG